MHDFSHPASDCRRHEDRNGGDFGQRRRQPADDQLDRKRHCGILYRFPKLKSHDHGGRRAIWKHAVKPRKLSGLRRAGEPLLFGRAGEFDVQRLSKFSSARRQRQHSDRDFRHHCGPCHGRSAATRWNTVAGKLNAGCCFPSRAYALEFVHRQFTQTGICRRCLVRLGSGWVRRRREHTTTASNRHRYASRHLHDYRDWNFRNDRAITSCDAQRQLIVMHYRA